jgi:hypothetical protein
VDAVVFKRKPRVTSRRPNKASLFAFGNDDSQPRISTRLFRTNYSDAEWNVRVGPDGKINSGINPQDPRHRNNVHKVTVPGPPWCILCKKAGHDNYDLMSNPTQSRRKRQRQRKKKRTGWPKIWRSRTRTRTEQVPPLGKSHFLASTCYL